MPKICIRTILPQLSVGGRRKSPTVFAGCLTSLSLDFRAHAVDSTGVFHHVTGRVIGKRSKQGCADTRQGRAAPSDQNLGALCSVWNVYIVLDSLQQNPLLTHTNPIAPPRPLS